MKIAVIGTGMVGRALAGRLDELGHEVAIGTRDVAATLARSEPGALGTPAYAVWQADHPRVALRELAEAGRAADLVVNASNGANALAAFAGVGRDNLAGKVLLDVALPLDFSAGMPPTHTVANTDSLGEQLQRAFPEARVVKALNTAFCEVMVDPSRIPGTHDTFVAGDDPAAKAVVRGLLASFGWPEEAVIDLGGIAGARASEMYMRLYFQLVEVFGTFEVGLRVRTPTR